jgi:hypothetical protein
VPLRIALTGAGFRVGSAGDPGAGDGDSRTDGTAVYVRGLAEPMPELPSWVHRP